MPNDQQPMPAPSRLGLTLFAIYVAAYGSFVGIAAFAGSLLQTRPVAGINLAVLAGLGLIAAPLVLAAIYLAWASRDDEAQP
jgi:uncharacterized membrane protein (DUF485 family)